VSEESAEEDERNILALSLYVLSIPPQDVFVIWVKM
jgi:hypothetical protein